MTYKLISKSAGFLLACSLMVPSLAAAENILRRAHDLSGGGAESLDPLTPTPFYYMNEVLFDTLVQPELGKDEPVPGLAISWSANAAATEWTFKLRDGVKFHDGSSFDANDVVYSFDRIKDPKLESPVTAMLSYVDKVVAIDPLTVKITLSAPNADFLTALKDDRVSIIGEGSGETIGTTGIGTGPFKITNYDPEGTTALAAFDDYWDGRPKMDGMTFVAIPDTEARVQALQAGQIDTDSVSIEHASLFSDTAKFQILPYNNGGWNGIVFRTDTPPFDDVRVRKALRIAVNREEMIKLIAGADGGEIGCDNPVWQGDPYYAAIDCKQDIEGAKKLLAAAGHPNGLDIEIYTSDLEPAMVRYAEVYQQQVAGFQQQSSQRQQLALSIRQILSSIFHHEPQHSVPLCVSRILSHHLLIQSVTITITIITTSSIGSSSWYCSGISEGVQEGGDQRFGRRGIRTQIICAAQLRLSPY